MVSKKEMERTEQKLKRSIESIEKEGKKLGKKLGVPLILVKSPKDIGDQFERRVYKNLKKDKFFVLKPKKRMNILI